MKTLKYKCTLLSDIVLNAKSSSEGANTTLDFIPGNNFLGVVARDYGRMTPQQAFAIFHSGEVRFGDAHPAVNGVRTLKAPALMFYPKLSAPEDGCILHHAYDRSKDNSNHGSPVQLKQLREGFYAFDKDKGIRALVNHNYAIKSAYDRTARRSADEMMYGYESLAKGTEYYFSVETDDDSLCEAIDKALIGNRHIGCSRTAQYGLVSIEKSDFNETPSRPSSDEVLVYADGRLIFLDDEGKPTMLPTPRQLGLTGGKIDWNRSQVRTFRYSPWNFKRQCFDTDRCGIEKGSVFVVTGCDMAGEGSTYVGSWRNEGFGRVIYNPSFLDAIPGSNGRAKTALSNDAEKPNDEPERFPGNEKLLAALRVMRKTAELEAEAYRIVNEFKDKYGKRFKQETFASQWGTVRSIVTRCRTKKEIVNRLFSSSVGAEGYIRHGVAKTKWDEYRRGEIFEKFVDTLTDENAVMVLVNLSAEMAKICRKGELR